jgi:hypothetical protein
MSTDNQQNKLIAQYSYHYNVWDVKSYHNIIILWLSLCATNSHLPTILFDSNFTYETYLWIILKLHEPSFLFTTRKYKMSTKPSICKNNQYYLT